MFDPKAAPVSEDNAVRNRETHPGPGRLSIADVAITHGAEKLFKSPLPQVHANTRALIFNTHHDGTVVFRSCANAD